MNQLRDSQVETLRLLDSLEGGTADEVSRCEERWFSSTERSLIRLAELGYLTRQWERRPGTGSGYSVYSLTQLGKESLEGRDGW